MPNGLVTSVFVLGESVEATTMEEKSRGRLRAQSGCHGLCLWTKADNHLFQREGCNPGLAGWLLCPGEQVCRSSVTRGRALSLRQLPTGEMTIPSSYCPIRLFSLF